VSVHVSPNNLMISPALPRMPLTDWSQISIIKPRDKEFHEEFVPKFGTHRGRGFEICNNF